MFVLQSFFLFRETNLLEIWFRFAMQALKFEQTARSLPRFCVTVVRLVCDLEEGEAAFRKA